MGAQLGAPHGAINRGGVTVATTIVAPPFPIPPPRASALVGLADLAIRSATLLLVRVDFVEVLRLLHKDEPFVRRFMQLHCRLLSALHRRAIEVPQPRVLW